MVQIMKMGESVTFTSDIKKNYHCVACGAKLEKEQIHRVVTRDDRDYFEYHKRNTFPYGDAHVYTTRYRCPSCGRRFSSEDQAVFHRIQKKLRLQRLSDDDIKANYGQAFNAQLRSRRITNIIADIFFLILVFVIGMATTDGDIMISGFYCLLTIAFFIISVLLSRSYRKRRGYTVEQIYLFQRLHANSVCNRDMIKRSKVCYCYNCVKELEPKSIKRYDSEDSALCPECGNATVIPDAISSQIDIASFNGCCEFLTTSYLNTQGKNSLSENASGFRLDTETLTLMKEYWL
ncbi:MAG: hypothetical protein IJY04_02020 [Clostridia bacterium]|nr:hypothetical protein [Clostridia bacterium]